MKPETPITSISPEQLSVQQGPNIERMGNPDKVEISGEIATEEYEQKAESMAAQSDADITTLLPAPVAVKAVVVEDTILVDSPLVASDDDLIEKEWVDKAKKIVKETQDNPYQRDNVVNKLKVDYLKKRYGRELGVTE